MLLRDALICATVVLTVPTAGRCAPDAPTMADALAKASIPKSGVYLAVNADKVRLPADSPPSSVGDAPSQIAATYGRLTWTFENVNAVAPPTMVIINEPPSEPNIYDGMPALDAITLFAATLTDAQWHMFTDEHGLGYTDLTSEMQRQLFKALLSHDGNLIVAPKPTLTTHYDASYKRDLTDEIPKCRIRMGQTIDLMLPVKGQPGSYYPFSAQPADNAEVQYMVTDQKNYGGSSDVVYGGHVRDEEPNVPKEGTLNFALPALKPAVTLSSIKTIGDLITRIDSATGLEIYADKRLEGVSVTVVGHGTAQAGNLLRALALDVTGTYRQVGPAYVLTDDVSGIGTRRERWYQFERQADALRTTPLNAATDTIYLHHKASDLSWFGDPGQYSPDEEKFNDGTVISVNKTTMLPALKLPLEKLTPAQQDIVRRSVDRFNQIYTTQTSTTDGVIEIRPGLSIQLLAPELPHPIDLNINQGSVDQGFLFREPREQSSADLKEYRAKYAKEHPAPAPPAETNAPWTSVAPALSAIPRRAVITHPRSVKEVDAEIEAVHKLGFNEIWIDVFSSGQSHVGNGKDDLLAYALRKAHTVGVATYATLDLLDWGQSPRDDIRDRNILGETSLQSTAREEELEAQRNPAPAQDPDDPAPPPAPNEAHVPGIIVNPMAPDVLSTLLDLTTSLTQARGLSGIVWRDTVGRGYGPQFNSGPISTDSEGTLLGYYEGMRLAFLRQYHADPLDVYPAGSYQGKANLSLPAFDRMDAQSASYTLNDDWKAFRRDANLTFLKILYVAVAPLGTLSTERLPILIKQRGEELGGRDYWGRTVRSAGWYGSWDTPDKAPPTFHRGGETSGPGDPGTAETQALAQSKMVDFVIDAAGLDFARKHLDAFKANMHVYDKGSIVLDLGMPDTDKDPLVELAAELMGTPATTAQGSGAGGIMPSK